MTSQFQGRLNLLELGFACCAVEASAVDLISDSTQLLDDTELRKYADHILVVAGTVTHALKPTLKDAYEQLSEPRVVVAFGACAISGGPYWDSYSVLPGAGELVPVDIFVPGCPPSPEDLAKALE
ncbi:MAG: hypothetical protein EBR84_03710, partial [Actinobacteria bacterium]|nr:hypothetical protein [Actinomycetota bacterium]